MWRNSPTLKRSAASGRVSTGTDPLPGAKVTVSSPNLQGSKSATTSNSGDYMFPSLPPGDYQVELKLEGYNPVTRRVTVEKDTPLTINEALEK